MAHFIGGVAYFAVAQLGGDHPDAVAGLITAVAGSVIAALPPIAPRGNIFAKTPFLRSTNSRNQLTSTPDLHTSTDTASLIQKYIDDLMKKDGSTTITATDTSGNVPVGAIDVTDAHTDGLLSNKVSRRQFPGRQVMQKAYNYFSHLRRKLVIMTLSAIFIGLLSLTAYYAYLKWPFTFFGLQQHILQFLRGAIAAWNYMCNGGLQHLHVAFIPIVRRTPSSLLEFGYHPSSNNLKRHVIVVIALFTIATLTLVWPYFTLDGIKPYVNAMRFGSPYVAQGDVTRNQIKNIRSAIPLDKSVSGVSSVSTLASRSWRFITSQAYRSWLIFIVYRDWVSKLLTQVYQFILTTYVSPYLPPQILNNAHALFWSSVRPVEESFDHHISQRVIELLERANDAIIEFLSGYPLLLSCYLFLYDFIVHQLWRVPVVAALTYLPMKALIDGLPAGPRSKLRFAMSLLVRITISCGLLFIPLSNSFKYQLDYATFIFTVIYCIRRINLAAATDENPNTVNHWKILSIGHTCQSFLQRIQDLLCGFRFRERVRGFYNEGQEWVLTSTHAVWQTMLDMLPQVNRTYSPTILRAFVFMAIIHGSIVFLKSIWDDGANLFSVVRNFWRPATDTVVELEEGG